MKLADKLAFLSPCIAKKDEFTNPGNEGLVQYNVTFAHLVEVLKSEQCMAAPVHVEMSDYGLGRIFPVPGGLGANVEQFVALNETVREIHGTTSVYSYFRRMEKRVDEKKTLPYMNFLKRMIEQDKQEEYVCQQRIPCCCRTKRKWLCIMTMSFAKGLRRKTAFLN